MKSVLISIKPKWCELIANGKKTVEVRKTKPKIDVPFKCYIYCTKAKDYFSIGGGIYVANDELYRLPTGEVKFGDTFELEGDWRGQYNENNFLNSKVIGEFICDNINTIEFWNGCVTQCGNTMPQYMAQDNTCLTMEEIKDYIGEGKDGYLWHISNLVIYDKPKELGEFYNPDKVTKGQCVNCVFNDGHGNFNGCNGSNCYENTRLKRPPQSWCYVEQLGV